jgi:hypothetical protein
MAYANLSEAVKSSAFETLSPEAKQHVFDTYSAKDEAYQALSPEAKAHVQQTYLGKAAEPVGEKTPAGAQPSPGMTPVTETGGGAALMAPTSRRRDVPVSEQIFGHDPQKMKLSSMGDYAKTIGTSAAIGGGIGLGAGLLSGPGALATGAAGVVLGAAGGLAEQVAKDLGYGKGVQVLAGAAAGSKLPTDAISTAYKSVLGSSVENFIAKKMAYKVGASTGIPGAGYAAQGMVGRAKEFITGGAKVDAEAGAKAFGQMEHINPATGEVTPITSTALHGEAGQMVNQRKVTEELAAAHPDAVVPGKPVSHGLYEQAKQSYDAIGKHGVNFLDSSEFRALTEGIPAQETKFGDLFRNAKGQPVVGQDVVENLKNATSKMSYQDAEKVREAFNKYLVSTTGKPSEKLAREAYTNEALAEAKDALPGLFEKGSKGASEIKAQLWNLSKVPEGMKQFNQEMQAYLTNATVKDAKAMWHEIGPEVQKRFNIPPEKYDIITEIMNGAQTPKELSQVRRLLMKLTIPVVAGPSQEQQ